MFSQCHYNLPSTKTNKLSSHAVLLNFHKRTILIKTQFTLRMRRNFHSWVNFFAFHLPYLNIFLAECYSGTHLLSTSPAFKVWALWLTFKPDLATLKVTGADSKYISKIKNVANWRKCHNWRKCPNYCSTFFRLHKLYKSICAYYAVWKE